MERTKEIGGWVIKGNALYGYRAEGRVTKIDVGFGVEKEKDPSS